MPELLLEHSYIRPPESEIYGRSLSTIRRLGAFMVGKPQIEAINSPEADQARVEFYTSVEEGFGTDMELGGGLEVRDFDERQVIDGQVMAKDLKTPVSAMTMAGLKCAEKTATEDKRFKPQLTRSKWDHKNALIVDKMASGETEYNTRIVISPYPIEAAEQSGEDYWRDIGYVPHLKRGFVQLYHTNGDEIITGSLSFDGSDKQRLREIFEQFGVEIPEEETTDNWLKYAVTGTYTEEAAKALATAIADQAGNKKNQKTTNTVDVTHEYESLMDSAFNESYIHVCESLYKGSQTVGARKLILVLADKAHHFNERYANALYKMRSDKTQFTEDDSVVLHEMLVYSTIEMMRAQHLRKTIVNSNHSIPSYGGVLFDADYLQAVDPSLFQEALSSFGAEGARSNRTYSACGLSISLGENNGQDSSDGPQTAFGGIENWNQGEDKYGSLTFKCPKGHTNVRPRNKLLEKCQKCGTSVRC